MAADCHIHMILDGINWKDAIARHSQKTDEAWIRERLQHMKDLGFTYLRDGGDRWGAGLLASQLAPEYGITYRTPAFPICRAGHYGVFIGRSFEDLASYRQLIQQAKQDGAHFIKIMISGLMDFDHFGVLTDSPAEPGLIHDMIAAAHDAGFAVMAHANGDEAVSAAIDGDIDSVEHGAYLSDETVQKLAESNAVWVPTLVTIANLIGDGRFPDDVLKPLLARQLRSVRLFADYGGHLACGSDAGAYLVYHGEGGQQEEKLLLDHLGTNGVQILDDGLARLRASF